MSKRIDVKTPMREAIDETKAEAEIAINTLKDVYEHPDKYTHTVKLSFDHTKWRNGKPLQVCLTFSDGKTMDAVIDNEECLEFMPVINNELYTVTVAKIFDENVIFDYSIKNKNDVYELAEKYSLFEEASEQFKLSTKIVFEISGQVRNVQNDGTECDLFSFDDGLLYKHIAIRDEEILKSIKFVPGMCLKIVVLMHEQFLFVLQCEKIERPNNSDKTKKGFVHTDFRIGTH